MSRCHTLSAFFAAAAVLLAGGAGVLRLSAAPRPAAVLAAEQTPPKEPGLRAAKEEERKAAIAAIEGQLKAFKADDYAKAEKYQASDLRQNFQSTEHFRRMMREVYPQFANYKSATFGDAKCDAKGEHLEILVTVTGQDKVTVRAVYLMIREAGEYRVEGVSGGIPRKVDLRNVI